MYIHLGRDYVLNDRDIIGISVRRFMAALDSSER